MHRVNARAAPGPPAAQAGELMRTRLLSLMSGRFDRPVTTLVAGAGFGKTTLLAQAWRQNLTTPIGIDAWVSCQPDDEDPERFVAACCRALGPEHDVSGGAGDVIAAMRQMSPIDVCLVIDDTHHLAGSGAQSVLTEVVPQLPVNGHVVFSGRVPVDVPLTRLRVTGGCVEIGERDLSFTPAEEEDLARLLDAAPPPRELAGWPALVRLALTSQRTLTQQFLWEEVVASLSPLEGRALLALALVGWADAAELSAICGEPVELERLTAKIPLLTTFDGRSVRAHDLWGESVDRLYSREQILALLPPVREWLAARHDALRLASIAVRFREPATIRLAARELVSQTMAALPMERARGLLAAAAPADRDTPELLLLRAAIEHALAVDNPATDALVASAAAALAAAGDEAGEVVALALSGLVASSRGAYADFLRIAARVGELPSARENVVLSVLTELVTATLADLRGDLAGALAALARLPHPASHHPMREMAARLHVTMLVLAGRTDEAIPIADAVLRTSDHPHVRKTPPFVRWSSGDVSEFAALRADDRLAPDTNARDQFFYAALGTYVRASAGDAGGLRELAGQLEAMAINLNDCRDASMLAAATVMRQVALHDEESARRLLAGHLDQFPLDDPRCDNQLRRALAPVYLCAPQVRPAWDAASLGRCHQRMHSVALALLAAREAAAAVSPLPAPAAESIVAVLADAEAVVTMLPLPMSVELAVRAHGHGLQAGRRAIELMERLLGSNVTVELRWQRAHGDDLVRRAAGELLTAADSGPLRSARIEVLGSARVYIGGSLVQNAATRRARVRQLLALLTVEPNLRRERAIALLWPDLDRAAAARNLRVTLTYLRQVLRGGTMTVQPRPGQTPDERFLIVDASTIRLLAHPGLEVDLWELEAHLAAAGRAWADGNSAEHAAALAAAAGLWRGEPLVDLQDLADLSGALTRVQTALVEATLALGEVRLSEGRAAEAMQSAQTVIAADGYNERAHRLAVATQIHLGDHGAAAAAAGRMAAALADAGVVPSRTTQILLRRIAAGAPAS